ncbi:MAG: hypothetical protein WBV28_21190 [Terracidiphilus sp.]
MIRQAISCDICGRDKQQTNHWFVVYEHGAELRISGWSSQARMSTKAKHLCGQTCLHKLVDEYMARILAAGAAALGIAAPGLEVRIPEARSPEIRNAEEKPAALAAPRTDASLTSNAAHLSSVPLAAPIPATYIDRYTSAAPAALPLNLSSRSEEEPIPNPPSFSARTWRAEAWKRERAREQRAALNAPPSRRHPIA